LVHGDHAGYPATAANDSRDECTDTEHSVAAGIISFGKIGQHVALVVGAVILLVSLVSAQSSESWPKKMAPQGKMGPSIMRKPRSSQSTAMKTVALASVVG